VGPPGRTEQFGFREGGGFQKERKFQKEHQLKGFEKSQALCVKLLYFSRKSCCKRGVLELYF